MTEAQITALINLGAAGAVIIVVVYFLRFIEKQEKTWQTFFHQLMENRETPINELTETIRALLSEFRNHDTWEHTKLEEMSKAVSEPKTQPRRKAQP